jgi:hypothetical protein
VVGEDQAALRGIMERTNCAITIAENALTGEEGDKNPEERVMSVTGTLEMILHAIGQVLNR